MCTYHVTLVDSEQTTLWQMTFDGNYTGDVTPPAELDALLEHGSSYQMVVMATSHAGLESADVAYGPLVVDRTSPSIGALLDGPDSPYDLTCLPVPAAPGCIVTIYLKKGER